MADLSILVPARNEEFLARTIEDILANMRGDTEVIAACDGYWPDPPIADHPRVTLLHFPVSIGQRAATNAACRLSSAKYVMKADAHCAFKEGFDVDMMAAMTDDATMVPVMRNLHTFDWVCEDGHRRYQSPSGPCTECGKPTVKDVVWIAKGNPQSTAYCFDPEPHFQYFREYRARPGGEPNPDCCLTETMSLQGSCWMLTRDKYWSLNICDEAFGSWGSQGIEVAVKTWLSGGRVVVNHNTWYAHMFRTQGGDFGFPYQISGRQVDRAKKHAKQLFFENKWPHQLYPLSWLVDRFWPVPGWTEDDRQALKAGENRVFPAVILPSPPAPVANLTTTPTRGVVYYTDCRGDEQVLSAVRKQISACTNGDEVISVSLNHPVDFGRNVVFNGERGVLTMFKQILAGVEASTSDIIFLCEHDVLYHPAHFDFTPPRKDMFYYDENRWFVDADSGKALFYHAMSTSMLVAHRDVLIAHYRNRVARVEKDGWNSRIGYEPGNRPPPSGVDHYKREAFFSIFPCIDIRHRHNLTPSRWSKDKFRNQGNLYAWTESDAVPGWGITKGRFHEILAAIHEEPPHALQTP